MAWGCFGIVLFLLGCGGLYLAQQARRQTAASQRWPQTEGRILTSALKSASGKNRTLYLASAEYEYTVANVAYRSSRLSFGDRYEDRPVAEAKLTQQYTPGAPVTVYYDPAAPASAVLERTERSAAALRFGGVTFLLVGLILIFNWQFGVSR